MNTKTPLMPQSASHVSSQPGAEHILQNLSHPVLAIDAEGLISYANAAAEASFDGWVVGRNLRDVLPGFSLPEDRHHRTTSTVLSSKMDDTYHLTLAPLDGGYFAVDLRSLMQAQEVNGTSDLDDLTGLGKRSTLMSRLSAELARSQGSSFAVHCLDLDRFKLVNDTLGHAIGDLLLKKVADRVKAACREGDVVCRMGGDEFVVLQFNIDDAASAERLASRIVDLLGRTYVLNGHTINIGVSVGVALPAASSQARDLLRDADLALYEAKRAGRSRYRMFENSMGASLQERREMEIDLRRALTLKQFELNYQPFLDLSTDTVIGFEALLRWQHPIKGSIAPLSFIALAEENGLIVKIGEWVLRNACKEAAAWPGEMIIAVNVSPLQFKADNLLETVSSALASSGLPAHRLELEITEGALLDDTDNVLSTLTALRDLGVKISMDDFGTGYSSLAYLQKFPFNKIKIDRSFVAGDNADSKAILRAVASLGTTLGMAITAEGVETAEQLERIRNERCTHVQGYLTGRPMRPDMIPAFISKSNLEHL